MPRGVGWHRGKVVLLSWSCQQTWTCDRWNVFSARGFFVSFFLLWSVFDGGKTVWILFDGSCFFCALREWFSVSVADGIGCSSGEAQEDRRGCARVTVPEPAKKCTTSCRWQYWSRVNKLSSQARNLQQAVGQIPFEQPVMEEVHAFAQKRTSKRTVEPLDGELGSCVVQEFAEFMEENMGGGKREVQTFFQECCHHLHERARGA